MSVDKDTVRRIAKLARIALEDDHDGIGNRFNVSFPSPP